jgi:uncharacterized membrane protein
MDTETIKEKKGIKESIDDLGTHVRSYVDTFYQLTVLKVTQKTTNIVSAIFATLVVCTLGVFMTFFAGVAFALWIGNRIESRVGGFLIVSGLFLVAVVILLLLRKKIVFPFIRKLFIKKIHE